VRNSNNFIRIFATRQTLDSRDYHWGSSSSSTSGPFVKGFAQGLERDRIGKLIETFWRIAVEPCWRRTRPAHPVPGRRQHARSRGYDQAAGSEVTLRQTARIAIELPESVLHYVIRTRGSVILDDPWCRICSRRDEYILKKHTRVSLPAW